MKSCEDIKNCILTDSDLKKNETLLFKKSVQKSGLKSIRFPVLCDQSGKITPDKGVGLSTQGIFGIFIKSTNKNGGGKVHYELSVQDSEMDTLLVKDHFLRTK